MVNLKYKIKFDWDNIIEILIYIFLIGFILVLFYFVVQLLIKGLSQPSPGIYPYGILGITLYGAKNYVKDKFILYTQDGMSSFGIIIDLEFKKFMN